MISGVWIGRLRQKKHQVAPEHRGKMSNAMKQYQYFSSNLPLLDSMTLFASKGKKKKTMSGGRMRKTIEGRDHNIWKHKELVNVEYVDSTIDI